MICSRALVLGNAKDWLLAAVEPDVSLLPSVEGRTSPSSVSAIVSKTPTNLISRFKEAIFDHSRVSDGQENSSRDLPSLFRIVEVCRSLIQWIKGGFENGSEEGVVKDIDVYSFDGVSHREVFGSFRSLQ